MRLPPNPGWQKKRVAASKPQALGMVLPAFVTRTRRFPLPSSRRPFNSYSIILGIYGRAVCNIFLLDIFEFGLKKGVYSKKSLHLTLYSDILR